MAPPLPYRQVRPWYGMGDIPLGFVFFLVVATVGSLIGMAFASFDDVVSYGSADDSIELPFGFLAVSLLFQQAGQGLWPFIVSKWKGLGAVTDWRLTFTPADLGIGVGVAFIGLGGAAAAGFIVSSLVGLTDEASADNTQILRDAEGTPWLAMILFAVVVGAPITEELFFRGLTLRAIEKRLGQVWAVVLSAVIFTLPHWIGSDWRGTLTLFGSIFVVGLVLGAAAVITDRIASSIIAHMILNAFGVAGALGYLDSFIP
jgi:membrane protease YdiL (CAAX protease family)